MASTSSKYMKLEPREHVLARPGMYIGSLESDEQTMWTYDDQSATAQYETISYVSGLYKIFDEMIVNALDHVVREQGSDTPVKDIRVSIDRNSGEIEIVNSGTGLEIVMHDEHRMYIPELIFGNMLTSTNYSETEERIIGGQNGIGAKACNIFSRKFELETVDGVRKKLYSQVFEDNMSRKSEPRILKCSKKPYTRVRFTPDYARFGGCDSGLSDGMYRLMRRRVVDACALTPPTVKVFLNEEMLEFRSFERYADLFLGKDRTDCPRVVYSDGKGKWDVVVAESDDGFRQMSFVNGVWTSKGGKHVEYVATTVAKKLAELVLKRRKTEIKPSRVRDTMFLLVRAVIPNPTFDSQTKETLTTPYTKFGTKPEFDAKFMDKVYKLGIVDRLINQASADADKSAKKTDGKKRSQIRGIPKLDDANFAGTAKSSKCTLILTEGDSAKTMAISGLSKVGRDYYGVFPLKGKVMNVKDTAAKRVNENEEISNMKKILGLESNKSYTDVSELRYGRIMIMTDADVDGSHIKGLVFNLFHSMWPSLLDKCNGFMTAMLTPIMKVSKGAKVASFYTLTEYQRWRDENDNGNGWHVKYYKGLGTSTTKEAKEYFEHMRLVHYDWEDTSNDAIDLAFNKKRPDDRKRWLEHYDRERVIECGESSVTHVGYNTFVHDELVHFSNYNLERSIPSVCDGLKRSQRKILFCCLKRRLVKEIKVAQLSGYVSEHGAYHHGEASLQDAIVGMAQNFTGSNNINLLMPNGQFGTRIQGGKDSASPRYIHTALNPITLSLFASDDDCVLQDQHEDGMAIEPLHYIPLLPMVLVNGAMGIGTGFSTSVPCYRPSAILANLRRLLDGQEPQRMIPWYKGFKGRIEWSEARHSYESVGCYRVKDPTTLEITELPIGTWTEDYKGLLDQLVDKSEAVKDYKSNYTEKDVHFTVKFASASHLTSWMILGESGFPKIETEMKLRSTKMLSVSNMHLYNRDGVIRKYEDEIAILKEFYEVRLQAYADRRVAKLAELETDSGFLQAKIRFVSSIIDGTMQIMNVPKADLEAELEAQEYPPMNDGYEYLTKLPLSSLTKERKRAMEIETESKEQALATLRNTTDRDLWRQELSSKALAVLDPKP